MSKKGPSIGGKLFNLKYWITIPETAKYLSIMLGEDVTEADVLRLALDNHLSLSVFFVNEVHAKYGQIVEYGDVDWPLIDIKTDEEKENSNDLNDMHDGILEEDEDLNDKISPDNVLYIGARGFLNLDGDIRPIMGDWDLPMIGNERLYVENRYQQLTDGPNVSYRYEDHSSYAPIAGTYIEDYIEKNICQLQIRSNLTENESSENKKKSYSPSFIPAKTLPEDSVLVVRTKSLIEFQEKISTVDSKENKSLDSRKERTYLNIIGALIEIVTGTFKGKSFTSETQLREFIAEKYDGFRGVSTRSLADKFALAKKAINDEPD